MKLKQLVIASALIAGLAVSVQASTLGYATSPAASSFWETFPSINFTNDAPDSVVGADFTSTLSVAMTGGSTPGSGERLYSGQGATPHAHNLSIGGATVSSIDSFTLQIKFTTPSGYTFGAANVGDFFTVTSSFGAPAYDYVVGTSNEGGQNVFNIVAWVWTGLDLQADSNFSIDIDSAANHVSLDGLRLTAAAIPEPSAFAALAGLGVLGLAATRRRRA